MMIRYDGTNFEGLMNHFNLIPRTTNASIPIPEHATHFDDKHRESLILCPLKEFWILAFDFDQVLSRDVLEMVVINLGSPQSCWGMRDPELLIGPISHAGQIRINRTMTREQSNWENIPTGSGLI